MKLKPSPSKTECLNPRTGRSMKVDTGIYDLVSKAICNSLKANEELTYTQLVESIQDCFKKQNTSFERSLGWYAVTVKNDMEVRGVIEVFLKSGKKLHRLKK